MKPIKTLDELKSIELSIMKKIHLFCVENKIQYYLAFGTLLGAIRHKGFIPWDDDIDIFMTRKEYNRFLDLFPCYAQNNNLSLANPKTKNYYGRPMTKVFDSRTYLIEPDFRSDVPYGVFVDVWVLDGVPSYNESRWLKKMKNRKRVLYASCLNFNKNFSIKKNIAIFLGRFLNYKKQCELFDLNASKYSFDEYDKCTCYLQGENNYFSYEKKWFESAKLCKFEDAEFYIPVGSHELLSRIYNDYMTLPPIEKQKPHHIINVYWK